MSILSAPAVSWKLLSPAVGISAVIARSVSVSVKVTPVKSPARTAVIVSALAVKVTLV
jgi:hypothetical protein